MSVGSQMPELDQGGFLPPPPPYKIGSQNTPYKAKVNQAQLCFNSKELHLNLS